MNLALVTGMLLGLSACMEAEEPSAVEPSDTEQTLGSAASLEPIDTSDSAAAVSWAGAIPLDEDCASVEAWMAANEAALPTGYDELSRFPVAYRRSIFSALPAAAKSRLWQQHFAAYVATHPELSPEQRRFIDKLSATISPELFAAPAGEGSSEEADAAIEKLEAEADTLFSMDEQYALMVNLGPDDPTEENDTLTGITPRARSCECSTSSDWCNRRGTRLGCAEGHEGCRKKRFGCGRFFRRGCNGLCKHY